MKEQIEQSLNIIVGSQLQDIGRAADLEWFIFSLSSNYDTIKKNEIPSIEYSLHVQCAWRILNPEGILVASRDRYYPTESNKQQDLMDFEWDKPGNNLCDERVAVFVKSFSERPISVLSIIADAVGSLRIELSHNHTIELFPDDSRGGEYWRFFKTNSMNEHFVITGKGVE